MYVLRPMALTDKPADGPEYVERTRMSYGKGQGGTMQWENTDVHAFYVQSHLDDLRGQAARERLARQARLAAPSGERRGLRRRVGLLLIVAGTALIGQPAMPVKPVTSSR